MVVNTKYFWLSLLACAVMSSTCYAVNNEGVISTEVTGIISGTPPIIYNKREQPGRVSLTKDSIRTIDKQLDIGDSVVASWSIADAEGDADNSQDSIVWYCTQPDETQHVIATGSDNYKITKEDKGCTIGLRITPETITGTPQKNTEIDITDVSAYDAIDNIIPGPVNPHSLNITNYIVAPDTGSAKEVESTALIHTAWPGAQLQLETDNTPSQVSWRSSDDSIASVTGEGLVTFNAKGSVTITATHGIGISDSITFSPDLFFVFSPQVRTWPGAREWCIGQGYTQPSIEQLSVGKDIRKIPGDSLWQEWGNISQQGAIYAGVVFWSSSVGSEGSDSYQYMYIKDGRISSNARSVQEGAVCLVA